MHMELITVLTFKQQFLLISNLCTDSDWTFTGRQLEIQGVTTYTLPHGCCNTAGNTSGLSNKQIPKGLCRYLFRVFGGRSTVIDHNLCHEYSIVFILLKVYYESSLFVMYRRDSYSFLSRQQMLGILANRKKPLRHGACAIVSVGNKLFWEATI